MDGTWPGREAMSNIDDKTKISLFAVAACIPVFVGVILWLASIDFKASAAQEELKNTKVLLLEIREKVIRIDQTLRDKHFYKER